MNMNMQDAEAKRKILRAKSVGAGKLFKSTIVDVDGEQYEIREPTVEEWSTIMATATVASDDGTTKTDYKAFVVSALLHCCFVPQTDVKVFEEGDRESIYKSPRSSPMRLLYEKAVDLMNLNEKVVEKN